MAEEEIVALEIYQIGDVVPLDGIYVQCSPEGIPVLSCEFAQGDLFPSTEDDGNYWRESTPTDF